MERDAQRDAERVLALLWEPRPEPADPARVARRLGIRVVAARLRADIAGALVKERGCDPVILLNAADANDRQRFYCAHELGHFVGRRVELDEYEYIDLRDLLTRLEPEEVYANQFARELLMPERKRRRLRGATDLELAVRFGLIREAVAPRQMLS